MATQREVLELIYKVAGLQEIDRSAAAVKKVDENLKRLKISGEDLATGAAGVGVYSTKLEQVSTAAKVTEKDLQRLKLEASRLAQVTSGRARFALLNMTQALQDSSQFSLGAAQGIRAVNNNLQAAAQSFVLLGLASKESGQGMKAALIGALKGPGGMLLAFSALSVVMELVSQSMSKAGSSAAELEGLFTDLALPTRTFAITTEAAAVAIEDLNKELPGFFDNVVQFMAALNAGFVSELFGSDGVKRIRNVKDALEDMIEEAEKTRELRDLLEKYFLVFDFGAEAVQKSRVELAKASGMAATYTQNIADEIVQKQIEIDLLNEEVEARKVIAGLKAVGLPAPSQRTLQSGRKITELTPGFTGLTPRSNLYGAGRVGVENLVRPNNKGMFGGVDGLLGGIQPLLQTKDPFLHLKTGSANVSEFEQSLNALSQTMGGTFANAAVAFGEAIPQLLDGTASLAGTGLAIIGSMAQEIGAAMIAFGTAGIALKAFTNNPVGAVIAGAALVALGAALTARADSIVGAGSRGGSISTAAPGVFSSGGAALNGNLITGGRPGQTRRIGGLDNRASIAASAVNVNVNMKAHGRELRAVMQNDAAAEARVVGSV